MQFLAELGIDSTNQGVSTGTKWIESKGPEIHSFSPVDGKKIGTTISADQLAYKQVINVSLQATKEWQQ